MDSITVSTAVAALARGIVARSTTRSTMSALIIAPPGLFGRLYLFPLQADSGFEGRGGGRSEVPEVCDVRRCGAVLERGLRVEERRRPVADEHGLDDALPRPSSQCVGDRPVAGKGRQRARVKGAREAKVEKQ